MQLQGSTALPPSRTGSSRRINPCAVDIIYSRSASRCFPRRVFCSSTWACATPPPSSRSRTTRPLSEQWVGIELWKRLQYLGRGRLLPAHQVWRRDRLHRRPGKAPAAHRGQVDRHAEPDRCTPPAGLSRRATHARPARLHRLSLPQAATPARAHHGFAVVVGIGNAPPLAGHFVQNSAATRRASRSIALDA
jgi:hypothetical protein